MTSANPEQTLAALLRREPVAWPAGGDPDAIERFVAAARQHGVLPLADAALADTALAHNALADGTLADRARACGAIAGGWPREIVAACREAALYGAMLELASRAEVAKVLDALAAAGAPALVLKGAALAYRHYPSPVLRPRADTDLLVAPERRDAAADVLAALGYSKGAGVEGEFVSYQATWSRRTAHGAASHVDLHWRINNSQMLAKALTFVDLAARAVALPELGPNARGPSDVDALLLACIHRAGHANAPCYGDGVAHLGERAIWLCDIHLLFTRMSASEQDEFAALAAAKRIRAICGDALRRSAEWFATPLPRRVMEVLDAPGPIEPSARYLSGGRARQMLGDFLAIERWSDRGRWIRETAFPSEAYMRGKYPESAGAWLPVLHARRLSSAIVKRMRRRGYPALLKG